MPRQACRNDLLGVPREKGSHAGLLLSRFLRIPSGDDEHSQERLKLFEAAQAAYKDQGFQNIYKMVFEQRQQFLQRATQMWLSVQGRLIVGLGAENVLEAGITLHHTYGVPIIPGTALKGLAAHYCDRVWGQKEKDREFKQEVYIEKGGQKKRQPGQYYQKLFGTTDDSGHIIFHDAWIKPESLTDPKQGLVPDVLTPHHGDYYMAKPTDDSIAPTDFDSPKPVTFLSVTGTFHVAVSCDVSDERGKKWELLAWTLLTQALAHWGVGGKTNAGYGRLVDSSASTTVVSEEGTQTAVAPPGPRFKPGEQITVRRIEDPKGRGRVWFQAEDGLSGRITQGTEPQLEINETISLWIVSASKDSYNFGSEAPQPARNISGRGRRTK